ncbi:hypothetical protein HCJ76_43730 [Streptomyces sp. MC1]|uniref:hypothetical protein n=1 Tax=Streptomyces sp. MC1 TaxID=295105 RepID=UPI0018C91B80|nr:hypothetical protein [Streptomyces sp. MC1]MBG7704795.1 hypothetical protein [Streptomyces sp. MC1]
MDLQRGGNRWRLPLPGVHGDAAVLADGSVWVLCGAAVVQWRDGVLRAAGGGFEANASLLLGPDSSVWVLSGSGATLGTGTGSTLALTRIDEQVGDQQRFALDFDAAVRSAAWLGERRFLLAASGHSAVVDLAVSTTTGPREDWMLTPLSYPGHLARSGGDTVLVAGRAGSGVGVELHALDTAGHTSDAIAEVQLGDVLGLVQSLVGKPAYLLGALPRNDIDAVHPVLAKITGHTATASSGAEAPEPPSADAYSEVRCLCPGSEEGLRPGEVPAAGRQGRHGHRPRGRTQGDGDRLRLQEAALAAREPDREDAA